jgi:NCS1 family nucleobase:cation symporter-1
MQMIENMRLTNGMTRRTLSTTVQRCQMDWRPTMSGTVPAGAPDATSPRPLLESRSVDFIPHDERYGHPRSLASLWFGANAMGVTLLTGSLAILTDLSLLWCVVAIAIGTLIGAVFVAYHSAQGPVLGLPQMIQSRAQFGFFGANIPMLVVVAMYLGFFGGGAVLAAQAMSELLGVSTRFGIFTTSVASVVLVIFGYDVLHKVAKVITPVFIVTFGVLTIVLATHWPGSGTRAVAHGGFSVTGFFFILGVVAAYHITYGPYVADYSRYLPAGTSHRATFWYTYIGIAAAGIWIMTLGAALQIAYSNLSIVAALSASADTAGGWLRILALVVLIVGVVNIDALNIYGAAMSTLTILTSFMRTLRVTRGFRVGFMLILGMIGTVGATLVAGDLISSYEDFIFFLITFLVPWSAINLADFYLVSRGQYDIADLFEPEGRYGKFNGPGLIAYGVGCLALAPFISTTFWTGPIAKAIGFDLSWLVGLIVPALLYVILCRSRYFSVRAVPAVGAAAVVEATN